MKKRIIYFVKTICVLIPWIWGATKLKYYDVGVFKTNEDKEYKKYKNLRYKIARIIDPNYKHGM